MCELEFKSVCIWYVLILQYVLKLEPSKKLESLRNK